LIYQVYRVQTHFIASSQINRQNYYQIGFLLWRIAFADMTSCSTNERAIWVEALQEPNHMHCVK